uniref:Uncharacterized protein n=1 Tax=Phocoena sinus TaxID=42100 RepID=A0A8C9CJX7_PHOSS
TTRGQHAPRSSGPRPKARLPTADSTAHMSPAPAAAQASVSVSLFDPKADTPVLQGLRLVSHAPGEALAQALQVSCPGIWKGLGKPLQGPLDISEKLFRSACDQTFPNHQEQREHYELDWHRFNLKQHLKDKPLRSALDFEKQSSTGDLSSISGSEDSDSASEEDLQILDEERAEFEKPDRSRGFHPHRVLFQNAQGQFLDAYCCVLGPRQASASTGCVVNSSLLYTQPRLSLSTVRVSLPSFLPVAGGYHT